MDIIQEKSPHLRRKDSLARMMIDVLIALAPTLIFAFVVYGLDCLMVFGISAGSMILAEFVYVLIRNQMPIDLEKHSLKERFLFAIKGYKFTNFLTALVSATIYTLIMPASASWYAVLIGALAGIILGKLVFGGTGNNIFNPAALGMLVSKLCFGSQYTYSYSGNFNYLKIPTYTTGGETGGSLMGEVVVHIGGTPLTQAGESYKYILNFDLLDMFLGKTPGTLGEGFKITILIGFIYLVIRHAAEWRIVLTYLGTFAFFMLFAGIMVNIQMPEISCWRFLGFHMLSGGLLFGAFFMLTDPVTSPIDKPSRVIYAALAAVFTVFIRLFGSLPEGVGFSILLANAFSALLDYYKWSSNKWKSWHIAALSSLVAVSFTVMMLVLNFTKLPGAESL